MQSAREAGRRAQCVNNLKQIGIAIHNYESTFKVLPFGKGDGYPGAPAYARWSTNSQLLMFIEQGNLYNSINFNNPPETPGMAGAVPFMPAYQNPDRCNATASRTQVATYLCPSDGPTLSDWAGGNNYLGNQQTWSCDLGDTQKSDLDPTAVVQGVFYFRSAVRLADVTDGLSNTAFFSEKLRGQDMADPRRSMLTMAVATSLADAVQKCAALPLTALPLTNRQGMSWVMGEMCCTNYNHVTTPNGRTCASIGFTGTMANMAMQVPPSSLHPGGVNLLAGDGSVRFVKDTTDLTTWRAIGTRNGGEVISGAN